MRELESLDDGECLRRWAEARDSLAAEELILRHEQALYAFSLRYCRREAEASDAVQETFTRMLQQAKRFEGRAGVRTWMFGIALNVLRAQRFQLGRIRRLFQSWEKVEVEPVDNSAKREERQAALREIEESVARLPRESREAILLHYYEGFDYEQMSEILGIPPGTVASRLNSARARLEEKARRRGVDLAALGGFSILGKQSGPALPPALQASLRALPTKLALPAAAVATGLALKWAGAILALTTLGASYALVERGERGESGRTLNEVLSASPRETKAVFPADDPACEDWEDQVLLRHALPLPVVPANADARSRPSRNLFRLRVQGLLQDGESGASLGCRALRLESLWPNANPSTQEPLKTDEFGRFDFEFSALDPGLYQLALDEALLGENAVVAPLVIDLRGDLLVPHSFLVWKASGVEKAAHLQKYRENLAQLLTERWHEEGRSYLRIALSGSWNENLRAEIFENQSALSPLLFVLDPLQGTLLLGPVPAGELRIELLSPERGFAILPAISVREREPREIHAWLQAGLEHLSVQAFHSGGIAAPGTRVDLIPAELWSGAPFASAIADAQGKICFDNLPPASSWRIRACSLEQNFGGPVPCARVCTANAGGETIRVEIR